MTEKDSGSIFDVLWRSYRLKWSLLLITTVAIFALRTTLMSGLNAVKEVNRRSANARTNFYSSMHASVDPKLAAPESALEGDEVEIRLFSTLLPVIRADPKIASNDKANESLARFDHRLSELNELMEQRRRCFDLQVDIPGTKTTITANALWALDLLPFTLVFVSVFLVMIDARQRACEIAQASMGASSKSRTAALTAAKSGYLIGTLHEVTRHRKTFYVYRNSPFVIPERLLTFGLWLLLSYSCLSLFPQINIPDNFSADSTVWGIHSVFAAACALGAAVVWKTWGFYEAQIHTTLGRPILRWRAAVTEHLTAVMNNRQLYAVAALFAFGAMLLPWDEPSGFLGVQFLWSQKPLTAAHGIQFFSIPPQIFHEFQFQVIVALLTIALSVVNQSTRHRRWLQILCGCLSSISLALVINLLSYWMMLYYRSDRELFSEITSLILGTGSLTGPRGLPMVLHEPKFGIGLFLVALTIICVAEIRLWVEKAVKVRAAAVS